MISETSAPPAWARFAPIGSWLPRYDRAFLPVDLLAGLALWAVMVPEAMAYASIVGVPAIMGLYTVVPPLVAYALLGTSRVLVVGPDTATGVISALTVGAITMRDSADFAALTSTLAVMIGVLFLVFGVLRLGWVSTFISTPVMRGFIEGLVCVTIIGQVATLIGLHGASGSAADKLVFIVRHLPQLSVPAAIAGLLCLAAMLLLRRYARRWPAALIVAAAATGAMVLFGAKAVGIDLVGAMPSGLPRLALPRLDPGILLALAPGAFSIVMVGYAEALGAAKAAMQARDEIDPNQELVAHGFANVSSGMFGGFLAVGSLSKTSVALGAGARSQVANLAAAALALLTLLFLTPLFRNLPHPALAAIVIAAMLHLSKPAYLRRLAAESRWEFALAATVFAGELALGVLQGIALGVVISLLLLIYRTSHIRTEVLGKLPGEQAFGDAARHAGARTYPGLLIFNAGGALFFASIDRFVRDLRAALAQSQTPVRQVLIDGSSITFVDASGCDALLALIEELRDQGTEVSFARVRSPIQDRMGRAGIVQAVGAAAFHHRISEGVNAFLAVGRE
jgi:high affinity sulfate transporter 1